MIKTPRVSITSLLCLAVCALWTALQAAESKPPAALSVKADRADAMYKQGQTVAFVVQLSADSALPGDAELAWKISKDGVPPIRTGTTNLVDGKVVLAARLDEPGFLLCQVTATSDGKPVSALGGAAVDPLLIKPSMPVPEDFDSFWSKQRKELAAVPMNPVLTPVATKGQPDVEGFDVRVDCAGGAPVSGYYARPRGAKPKSLPILLSVHGAGVYSASLGGAVDWCSKGMLAMDINAHGISNGCPSEYYTSLNQTTLNGYPRKGRESRDKLYFLGMFLRVFRAVDFLTAQPEWDGKTVVIYGSSQGGFQAFAAGLDERVSFIAAGVPAGCDHTGVVAGRVNGWPKLVPEGPDGKPDAQVLQVARYFDNVNFAARTKAKAAFVTVGFIDQTCPPSTVYAAYNNLPIPKKIYNDIPSAHTNTPEATQARIEAVMAFVKSVQ